VELGGERDRSDLLNVLFDIFDGRIRKPSIAIFREKKEKTRWMGGGQDEKLHGQDCMSPVSANALGALGP